MCRWTFIIYTQSKIDIIIITIIIIITVKQDTAPQEPSITIDLSGANNDITHESESLLVMGNIINDSQDILDLSKTRIPPEEMDNKPETSNVMFFHK